MSDLSGGSAEPGSAGFHYYFGIFMGICRGPVNAVIAAKVGGKLAWAGNVTARSVNQIDNPNLFGGPKKEGGIKGFFEAFFGEPDQSTAGTALLQLCAPAPVPDCRKVLTIHYDGLISSVNPYPKAWAWRIRRSTKGWDGEPLAPELAMIELSGQVTPPDARPPPQLAPATYNFLLPYSHTVTLHIDPPYVFGATTAIVEITGVADAETFEGALVVGTEFLPDGSADVKVPFKWINKAMAVGFRYSINGGPPINHLPYNDTAYEWDHEVVIRIPPPANSAINEVTQVIDNSVPEFPSGKYFYLKSLEPDGSAIVAVDPGMFGKEAHVFFRYVPTGSPVSILGDIYTTAYEIPNPALIAAEAPSGGTYHSTTGVSTVNEGSQGPDWVPANLPFREEGPGETPAIGLIGILTPLYEGQTVSVSFRYTPSLGADANVEYEASIHAMNGAHIIYECLTNREWGRGLDRSAIATQSFIDAAQTLFNEGFGLCMMWKRRDDLKVFIQNVLDHIGAVLRTNRTTALLELRLIRGDYDRNALKLWTTSNGILEISDSAVSTSSVVINEVIVTYRDPIYNEDRSVNEQNLSALQSGAFNTQTTEYRGIPTPSLARRVALRDLKSYSGNLRKFKLTVDRRGSDLIPGDVMRFQDISRGIPDTVVRIARSEDGTLTDGKCVLDVVQDVFSFPVAGFTQDQPNTWVPANFTPCIGEHEVFELPYFLINRAMSSADFAMLDSASAYIGTIAELGQPMNVSYEVAVRDAPPTGDDVPLEADRLYCGYIP